MERPAEIPPINIYIADQLEGMVDFHAKDYFRKQTYRKAVAAIRQYPHPITSGQQARQFITGVGESVEKAINEILMTGQVQVLANQPPSEAEKRRVIKLFTKIPQVGVEKAAIWYSHGYRTYQDLVDLYQRNVMTAGQKLGFEHLNDLLQTIPRQEMDLYNNLLHRLLDPYGVEFVLAGSYRRLHPSSGDVDIVVNARTKSGVKINMGALVKTLTDSGLIIGSFTPDAEVKFMGLSRLPATSELPKPLVRHFDVRLIEPENWAFALLYFTGSGDFNKKMRQVVSSLGYKLSEYGIFAKDTNQPAFPPEKKPRTEEEIFDFFGLEYLRPEERTNQVQLRFKEGRAPLHPEILKVEQKWFRPVETLFIYASNLQKLASLTIPRMIAGFDLDNTLITTAKNKPFSLDPNDVELLDNRIPFLKRLVEQGYVIAVYTNQYAKTEKKREQIFAKLQKVVQLLEVPLLLLAALGKDEYRKPAVGMWNWTERIVVSIDKTKSFYCGDAAGRPGDFSDSDLVFAQNLGIQFYTPEQVFQP